MFAASVPWTPPSLATQGVFLLLVAFVCVSFVLAVHRSAPSDSRRAWTRRALGGLGLWLLGTAAISASGLLELGPPLLVGFLLGCNGAAVALALSPVGRRMAHTVPLIALVAFQAFRLPLELLLHSWAEAGVIPVSMTWEGQNFDVITGVAATAAASLMWVLPVRRDLVAWMFSLLGLALLANVARVAVLSSPGPQRIFGDPPLALAFHVPEVWIVPICVAGALFGHIVLLRALLQRRSACKTQADVLGRPHP